MRILILGQVGSERCVGPAVVCSCGNVSFGIDDMDVRYRQIKHERECVK